MDEGRCGVPGFFKAFDKVPQIRLGEIEARLFGGNLPIRWVYRID